MCAFLCRMVHNSIIKSQATQTMEELIMAIKQNQGVNVNRKFGIEIEFGTKSSRAEVIERLRQGGVSVETQQWSDHSNRDYSDYVWKLTTDGSLHFKHCTGMELVSPPMTIAGGGLEAIRKVCDILNSPEIDAKINITCGLHVHHDVADYTHYNMKSLVNIMTRYTKAFDELVAPSRREGGDKSKWCRPLFNTDLAEEYRNERISDFQQCKTIEEQANFFGSRYMRLNLQSYVCYGTVEFRQHQGTTDADKICNWVILTQMAVERGANASVSAKQGADDWFNLKKILRGYAWMGADELQVQAIDFYNKRRQDFIKADKVQVSDETQSIINDLMAMGA